jgi:hypothetical protein
MPKEVLPPLVNGDRLDQKTFHERFEAMPDVHAELIGGIVFVTSRQRVLPGTQHVKLAHLTSVYVGETPGAEGAVSATTILGPDAEPEPDTLLRILPECGGQTGVDNRGYLTGAPEWIGEISENAESIDLNRKKLDYEKARVREYMVAAVRTNQIFWFIRRRGKFKSLAAGADGIIRSEVFPGFWFHADAFLHSDRKRLLAALRKGLASAEHAAFVAKLANKRKER